MRSLISIELKGLSDALFLKKLVYNVVLVESLLDRHMKIRHTFSDLITLAKCIWHTRGFHLGGSKSNFSNCLFWQCRRVDLKVLEHHGSSILTIRTSIAQYQLPKRMSRNRPIYSSASRTNLDRCVTYLMYTEDKVAAWRNRESCP